MTNILIGMEIEEAKRLLDSENKAYSIIEVSTFKLNQWDCICVLKAVEDSSGIVLYTAKFRKQTGEVAVEII